MTEENGDLNKTLEVKGLNKWIHSDQIQVEYGKCWGLTDSLRTIYLGELTRVEEFFKTGKTKGLHPLQIKILQDIKELEGKDDGDQRRVEQSGNFRSRSVRDFKHREKTTRRTTSTKRTAVRKAKFTQPSLPTE